MKGFIYKTNKKPTNQEPCDSILSAIFTKEYFCLWDESVRERERERENFFRQNLNSKPQDTTDVKYVCVCEMYELLNFLLSIVDWWITCSLLGVYYVCLCCKLT